MRKIFRIFLYIIINFILIQNISNATEEIIEKEKEFFGISEFVVAAEEYTNEVFPDLDLNEIVENAIRGKTDLGFFKKAIIKLIGQDISEGIELMISVLIIIIINSICKSIIENLGNGESSKIIYFLQYLVIAVLVLKSFSNVLSITKSSITKVIDFMNLLVPLFTTLILTTGSIASSNMVQPILLFMINFMGNFFENVLIPILLISVSISVCANLSDKVQLDGISKFLKSTILWFIGIILTVFTTTLSLEGTLTASVDGLTSKTAKAAVSNLIPVVGKLLGDSVETVIGCSNILKNTVGIVGVIIIISIVISPIIKICIFTFCFKLTAAIGEVVAEPKISKLVSTLAENYKILLGILCSVSVMFIIGITLVLKITNSSIMYR